MCLIEVRGKTLDQPVCKHAEARHFRQRGSVLPVSNNTGNKHVDKAHSGEGRYWRGFNSVTERES